MFWINKRRVLLLDVKKSQIKGGVNSHGTKSRPKSFECEKRIMREKGVDRDGKRCLGGKEKGCLKGRGTPPVQGTASEGQTLLTESAGGSDHYSADRWSAGRVRCVGWGSVNLLLVEHTSA